MANTYEKLRDFLEDEIDEIVKADSIDKDKLHCIYEMVDIIKDIGEIDDHDSGYSQTGGRMYYDPMMYGYSGANRNRDAMGRYSRNSYGRGGTYSGGNSYRGYSRTGDTMGNLQRMMDEAQTDQERDAIRRVMEMM